MKVTTYIAYALAIIGAIVWLLIGLFDFNLVAYVFGAGSVPARIIYSLVGIAGLWLIFYLILFKPMKNA